MEINDGWKKVIYAHDCEPCDMCDDVICPECDGTHYFECECPGPMQEDEYEYEEFHGVEYARRLEN